jgi:hypothetical protein
MARMACKEFLNQLDCWMDGDNSPSAREHLTGCPGCRGIVDDLAAITAVAHSMSEEPSEPPAHLWDSIRAQLVQEGVIRQTPSRPIQAPRNFWQGWFALPAPALAGISMVILLAASLALRGPLTRRMNDYRWMRGTQNSTSHLGAQLDSVEHATVASLASNPVVTAALHKNLAIVDNYISLCEKSVREDPQSEMARDFLYDAYQQKADLLAQMNEQGE